MNIRVMENCPFCHGTTYKDCPECDGTGYDALDGGQCDVCCGHGEVDCDFHLCEDGYVDKEELKEHKEYGGSVPTKTCDGCGDYPSTWYDEEQDMYFCDNCS